MTPRKMLEKKKKASESIDPRISCEVLENALAFTKKNTVFACSFSFDTESKIVALKRGKPNSLLHLPPP